MNTATTIAILTPPGRGAVATIEVAGPRAVASVERFFQPANRRPLAAQTIGGIVFGRWGIATGEELVVCRRAAERMEIHCHGGNAACALIVESLEALGCRRIDWQTSLSQTAADPLAREAQISLAAASTERAALVLLDQYSGTLRRAIEEIRRLLESSQLVAAREAIARILQFASLGLHLARPWKVVLAGPPNVGKSSLINALVGYRRALVYDLPGTTRDVVSAPAALDGWPVEFFDTAGLRGDADPLESLGIELAQEHLQKADLAVLVFDASQTWGAEQSQLCRQWPTALRVHNKCDLLGSEPIEPPASGLLISAKFVTGIEALIAAIVSRLIRDVPSPGSAVPFTERQVQALQRTLASLERGARLEALCQIGEL